MKNLIILGLGGHSKVVKEIVAENKFIQTIGFLDDKFLKNIKDTSSTNDNLLGPLNDINSFEIKNKYHLGFVAIGDNKLREKWLKRLLKLNYEIPNIIHSKAFVSPSANINKGTAIFANAVVQTNVNIGNGCIINTSSTIDHETRISKFTHICPGVNIAGNVMVGSNCFIGIGSSIIQNIKVGNNVTIGAGSVVLNDIPDNSKAYGIPAKIVT